MEISLEGAFLYRVRLLLGMFEVGVLPGGTGFDTAVHCSREMHVCLRPD